MIGTIQRVPLREVWKHEALNFTTWLENHPDELSKVLGISLTDIKREHDADEFVVDLVAQTDSSETVVIENQLGKSDHDHLGKILTYLAAMDAKVAVWIVAEPRTAHCKAIEWLNESGLAHFYLLKLEAIRIGDSCPAPLLTLISGPSNDSTQIGEKKKELGLHGEKNYQFFEQLLDRARGKTPLHANISPSKYHWVGASAGRAGLALNYCILKDKARIDFYIDIDKKNGGPGNKELFNRLEANKAGIEQEFGGPLFWDRQDDVRVSRVSALVEKGGLLDEDKWSVIQEAMVDAMIRFERALRPRLDRM